MKKKFTEGEWCVSEKVEGVISNADTYGDIVCFAPAKHDASMENWEANAKLIAAAPDLLEANNSLVACVESLLVWMNHYRAITMTEEKQAVNRVKKSVENAKQAIEKATK